MSNPYDLLAAHPDLTLVFHPLPVGERGRWYPALHTIVIDDSLTQAERRCTLMHELVHRLRGDVHTSDERESSRQERDCHEMAARMLIPLGELRNAMQWGRDPHELAEELFVDLETLQARIKGLTQWETEAVIGDLVLDDEKWSVA